jgi:arabinan endo-1,5-alpha-L-arabinosidase
MIFLLSASAMPAFSENDDKQDGKCLSVFADTVYRNPLFEPDLADPSCIRADDGWFYACGTQNTWEPGVVRITPIIRSRNLIEWEFVANGFTQKPSWKREGGIWAPQIVRNATDGRYYLYYAFSAWGDSNPGIGVARSERPYGPFDDLGKVFDSHDIGVGNSIDPFYMEVYSGGNRKTYLFWGSFRGIYGIEMQPDMKTTAGSKFQIAGNRFEGTYIYEKDGRFYFFASSGTCCNGKDSQYHLTVARADNVKGPYLRKDGQSILADGVEGSPLLHGSVSAGWVGPGHNGEIIKDDYGRYFMLYHAIDCSNPLLPDGATRRPLMMDEIVWDADGWPSIADGLPSNRYRMAPRFDK